MSVHLPTHRTKPLSYRSTSDTSTMKVQPGITSITLDHFIHRIWTTTLAIHWAVPAIIKFFNGLGGGGGGGPHHWGAPQTASYIGPGEALITSDMGSRGAYIALTPVMEPAVRLRIRTVERLGSLVPKPLLTFQCSACTLKGGCGLGTRLGISAEHIIRCKSFILYYTRLASSPGLRGEGKGRPGTHCMRMCHVFRIFYRKSTGRTCSYHGEGLPK